MAKKKLNVKFLALVIGSLGVGVAVLGLIVLLQFRNDPVRHVKRGNTLMERGDYETAMQQYIRAIGKDPAQMEYYDLAIAAGKKYEPQSQDRMRELFQMMNSVMAKKVEYVGPDGDLTAKDVRDQSTSELLENLDVYTFSTPRTRDNQVVKIHDMISTRVRDIDGSFYGLGEDEVDPRIRSAVRGLVVAPLWRGAYNLDEGDWQDGVEDIQEAIDLNPGYVPTQYGLLRGMLERFDSELKTAPDAKLRRVLAGINERIKEARDAADGPSPELDLLEFERNQILLFAGKTGDGEDGLGSAPDPAMMEGIIEGMRELMASDLEEYELRARIVELWWSFYRAMSRKPVSAIGQAEMDEIYEALVSGLKSAMDLMADIDGEGETDLRSDWLFLVFMNPGGSQADVASSIDRIDEMIAAAEEVKAIGPNLYVADGLLSIALMKRFDFTLRRSSMLEVMSEEAREELVNSYEAIRDSYSDEEGREQDAMWARVQLLYKTRMAMDAEIQANMTDDQNLARSLRAESIEYANEAAAAARACEKNGTQLDGFALEAAILVARRTGEVGTATRLFQSAMERSPAAANDLALQVRLAELLAQSGDIEGADQILRSIRLGLDGSDQETLQRIAGVESIIRKSVAGDSLADLPGIELLNDVMAARIAGDADEVRRLLDQIVEGRNIDRKVLLLGLLDRASLEEAEGNYEGMKMFASRALEIDPTSVRAKIFLKTDANTTGLDRMRTMAESQFEDPQDIDVQQARNLASLLGEPGSLPKDQLDEMRAALAELQLRIETAQTLRPMAITYLFERAVLGGDYAKASEYLDQLTLEQGGDTPKTIAMAAKLAQAQGDLDGAVTILANAIDNQGFGSDTMRLLLGEAYEKRGDREDARAQFHEAFKQAPNRWKNALRYGQALLAEGMVSDALQVLRAGRATGRSNPNYRDTWLYVEIQSGNFENAIKERRRLYKLDKFNHKNAIELARMLAESPIGREAIVHDKSNPRTGVVAGEVRFNPVEWGRLSREDRRAYQIEARNDRLLEAKGIFEELRRTDPTSPDVVVGSMAFGTNHKEMALSGDVIGEAEAQLRDKIANETGMAQLISNGRLSRILAEKGRIAYQAGDFETADASFEEAVQLDSQTVDEAVTAIVSSLYSQNDLERASKYQAVLLDRMEKIGANQAVRRRIAAQLANMYVGNGNLEQAALVANGYFDVDSSDSAELTVLGTIAFGRADVLRREQGEGVDGGLPEEVLEELGRSEEIYEKALEANARNIETLLQLAAIAEYRWLYSSESQSEAAFEGAEKAARRVVDSNQAYWPARLRLVTLLNREDKVAEAITELREHLELMPDTSRARALLIQLLEQDGRIADAIDVAQASLERDSTNVEWARLLGRLRGINKEYSEAAQLFAALYAQTGDINYLRSQVTTLMAWTETDGSKPGAAQVIELVRPNQSVFARDLTLIGAYCTALVDVGRRNEGLRNFENAFRGARDRPTSQRVALSNWVSRLYPDTPEGVAELSAFVDRISDENPSVVDLIEVARAWDSVGDKEAAVGTAQTAVAIDADEVETASALGLLGVLLTKSGECTEALDAFERALALRETDPQLLNNIAFLMSKCDGDLELALERAQQAVKERPYRPEYRDTLGAVHLARARSASDSDLKAKEYRQARQELELAARLGTLPSPLLQLAELEIELENYEQARRSLRRAGDRNPNAEVQQQIDELLEKVKGR